MLKNRVLDVLKDVEESLGRRGIEDSRLEGEIFLSNMLKCKRLDLYLNENKLNSRQISKVKDFLCCRSTRRPLQYIIKEAEFMGLKLYVSAGAFIPRPETEILVEQAISAAKNIKARPLKILDIGTGSGNIAIALTKYITSCKIIGLDISKKALSVAKKNARHNGAGGLIKFIKSDLFESIEKLDIKFDIIVSNPPYIPSGDMPALQTEVLSEPAQALDGGVDGLDYYRKIIAGAPLHLKSDGFLIMELGFGQSSEVSDLIKRSGFLRLNKIIKDYSGINRVIIARKR